MLLGPSLRRSRIGLLAGDPRIPWREAAGAVDDGAVEADEVALQLAGKRIHDERRRASAATRIEGVCVRLYAPGVRRVPVLVVPYQAEFPLHVEHGHSVMGQRYQVAVGHQLAGYAEGAVLEAFRQ